MQVPGSGFWISRIFPFFFPENLDVLGVNCHYLNNENIT